MHVIVLVECHRPSLYAAMVTEAMRLSLVDCFIIFFPVV